MIKKQASLIFLLLVVMFFFLSTKTMYAEDKINITINAGTKRIANLYRPGEDVILNIRVENPFPEVNKLFINYTVKNFHEKNILDKNITILLPAKDIKEEKLPISIKENGFFKIQLKISDSKGPVLSQPEVRLAIVPEPEENKNEDTAFGLFGLREDQRLLALMREMGFSWTIGGEGSFDLLTKNGFKILSILSDSTKETSTAPEEQGYSTYMPLLEPWKERVRNTAGHFKGRIKHWQVWGEPSHAYFWHTVPNDPKTRADKYAELLKFTYPIIKEEDPNAIVLCGGIVNVDHGIDFLEEILKRGCGNYFDILSIHYYRNAWNPEAYGPLIFKLDSVPNMMKYIKDMMARYNIQKPIWVTEMGWATALGSLTVSGSQTEFDQANFLVRGAILFLANGVEKVFINGPCDDQYGFLKSDLSPRPSFVACSTMLRKLMGANFSKKLEVDQGVYILVFKKNEKPVICAWSLKNKNVNIEWNLPKVNITDLMGNTSTREVKGGKLKVLLTESPVFID